MFLCCLKLTIITGEIWVTGYTFLLWHLQLDVGVLIQHLESHLPLWARPLQLVIIFTRQQLHKYSEICPVQQRPYPVSIAPSGVLPWAVYSGSKFTSFQKILKIIHLQGNVWTFDLRQIDVIDWEAACRVSCSFLDLKLHLEVLGGIQGNMLELPMTCWLTCREDFVMTTWHYLNINGCTIRYSLNSNCNQGKRSNIVHGSSAS